jgi:hypothetical protein
VEVGDYAELFNINEVSCCNTSVRRVHEMDLRMGGRIRPKIQNGFR